MIRDWRTLPGPGPIGNPERSNNVYMTVFCRLEDLAMGRLTQSELEDLAVDETTCVSLLAREELNRRAEL